MRGVYFVLTLICFETAYGYSRFKRAIPNGYGVNHPCPGKGHWDAVGHMNGGYTPQKNVFGQDFRSAGTVWTVELCNKDSDGDGLTNGEELGDPQCKWRPRDPPPGPVKGHPGFCEPDRAKCDSGMTHDECPNPHARGRGRQRTPPRRLPPGANDHPQTSLKKNLDRGGMGQSVPGFGFGGGSGMSFPPSSGFGGVPGGFGPDSGNFDSNFGGASQGPSFNFAGPGSQSLQPRTRPGFNSGVGGDRFGAPGLSRDFHMSGESRPGFSSRGGDFSMGQSPEFSRFSSSLDQRAIHGMGSSPSGPSLTGSLSRFEIDRSVQARMDRERSRLGGGGMGPRNFGSGGMAPSLGAGHGGMNTMGGGAGMGQMIGNGMNPMTGGGMGPMGGPGLGPVGTGMGTNGIVPGFSGGMEGYPPFMGAGNQFQNRMSMVGHPGMSQGPDGMVHISAFSG